MWKLKGKLLKAIDFRWEIRTWKLLNTKEESLAFTSILDSLIGKLHPLADKVKRVSDVKIEVKHFRRISEFLPSISLRHWTWVIQVRARHDSPVSVWNGSRCSIVHLVRLNHDVGRSGEKSLSSVMNSKKCCIVWQIRSWWDVGSARTRPESAWYTKTPVRCPQRKRVANEVH